MLSRRELALLPAVCLSLPAVTGAALLVGRGRVFFLPPLAVVRPRRLVRERVSVLLRPPDRAVRGLPPHVPRAAKHRPGAASTTARSGARSCGARSMPPRTFSRARPARPDRDVAADGYSQPYVAAVAYGSAFYGFATIVLGIGAARRILGAGALGSGLAVWFGTPTALLHVHRAAVLARLLRVRRGRFVTVWLHVRDRGRSGARSRSARRLRSWRWCASRMRCSRRPGARLPGHGGEPDGRRAPRPGVAARPGAGRLRRVRGWLPAAAARLPGAERPAAAVASSSCAR